MNVSEGEVNDGGALTVSDYLKRDTVLAMKHFPKKIHGVMMVEVKFEGHEHIKKKG